MIEENTYSAILLRTRQYAIFINVYMILGTFLTGLLTWHFHVLLILWIGSITFLLLPIIAKRYFMNRFSRLTTFRITKDCIFISSNLGNQKNDDGFEIRFQDLIFYKYEKGYGNPYLILYFKSGEKKAFDFQSRTEQEEHILDVILRQIKEYNSEHQRDKIDIKPNFIASKNGLICMTILGVGWIFICIILASRHSKAIPFSIIGGLAMFIQTIVLRNNALKSYKEQEGI